MAWIVPTHQAQKVPRADASGERPIVPLLDILTDTQTTEPMATNHLQALTITVDPSLTGGAATVQARANQDSDWYELSSIDLSGSDSPVSERYNCPIGQVRVVMAGIAGSAEVWAQGILVDRG